MKNIKFLIILVFCVILTGVGTFALTSYMQSKPDEPIPVTQNDFTITNSEQQISNNQPSTSVIETESETSVEDMTNTENVVSTEEAIPVETEVEEVTSTEEVTPTEVEEVISTEVEEVIYDEETEEGTGGDWEPEGGNIYDYLSDEDDAKVAAITTPEFITAINTMLYEGCIDEPVTFYSFENNTLTLLGEKYAYSYGVSGDGAAFCNQLIMSEFEKRMN